MPAVDPKKLKRLLTQGVLFPFALKRKLSGAQLADLAERAMADKRFDLSAVSDEFAGYMNEDQATDWAEEFERAGTAPHLYTTLEGDKSKPEEMFGNVPLREIEGMSAEERLRLANKVADETRRNAKTR